MNSLCCRVGESASKGRGVAADYVSGLMIGVNATFFGLAGTSIRLVSSPCPEPSWCWPNLLPQSFRMFQVQMYEIFSIYPPNLDSGSVLSTKIRGLGMSAVVWDGQTTCERCFHWSWKFPCPLLSTGRSKGVGSRPDKPTVRFLTAHTGRIASRSRIYITLVFTGC